MFKSIAYLWFIINDLVERAEATGEPGVNKQVMVVDGVHAILIAMGNEHLACRCEARLRRLVNAAVSIKNFYGEMDNRKGQVITHAAIVGALK